MSEKQSLYKLQNLSCRYSKEKEDTVLVVENLEIPQEELIVILGESGSGKTTLLETLALMDNTLIDDPKLKLLFMPDSPQEEDFADLWKKNKSSDIAKIRKWHFSFIFQDTNLMPNFNVSENIVLTKLIQGDKTETGEERTISDLIQETKLGKIDPDKSPLALSGGEKQRIAFVRAVYPDYSVLFGDEPTGSLDEGNSKIIMNKLRDEVNEHKKTVIIVSHNIDLSLLYADRVIVLEKITDKCSTIKSENIFVKKDNKWFNAGTNEETTDIKGNIQRILKSSTNTEEQLIQNYEYDNLKTSCFEKFLKGICGVKDFALLFFKKEFLALLGFEINTDNKKEPKKEKNNIMDFFRKIKLFRLLLCLIITSLSIGIIGYINGQLADELKKQQKNPLMMRIVTKVSNSTEIMNKIEQRKNNEKDFGLKNVSGENHFYDPLIKYYDTKETYTAVKSAYGLVINPVKDSLLIQELLKNSTKKNSKIEPVSNILNETSLGLIVTEKFLKELRYPENCPYLFVECPKSNIPYITVPVAKIVDKDNILYEGCNFLCTEYFHYNYNIDLNSENVPFVPSVNNTEMWIFLNKSGINLKEKNIEASLSTFFKKESAMPENINIFPEKTNIADGYKIKITLNNNVPIYELYNKLVLENKLFTDTTSFLLHNARAKSLDNEYNYNYLVLNFDNYDKIKKFNKWWLEQKFKNIDDSVISEKFVFQTVSDIADLAIWIIIVLAMITVTVLFVDLLTSHLDKISRNIGSYLAFGLDRKTLRAVYLFVIGVFISLIICLSIILNLIAKIVVSTVLNHYTIYLTVGITVLSSIICSYFALEKYLIKTPGDLIYNRNRPKRKDKKITFLRISLIFNKFRHVTTKQPVEDISLDKQTVALLDKYKNNAKKMYDTAIELNDNRYYSFALETCEKALAIQPDDQEMRALQNEIKQK